MRIFEPVLIIKFIPKAMGRIIPYKNLSRKGSGFLKTIVYDCNFCRYIKTNLYKPNLMM